MQRQAEAVNRPARDRDKGKAGSLLPHRPHPGGNLGQPGPRQPRDAQRHRAAGLQGGVKLRYSASFGRHDLPLVAKALDRCHSWIFEQKAPDLIAV